MLLLQIDRHNIIVLRLNSKIPTPVNMAVFDPKLSTKVTLDDTTPLTCNIEAAHNVKDHTVSTKKALV